MKRRKSHIEIRDLSLIRHVEIRDLLAEFGARLHGSDPGVSAFVDVDAGRRALLDFGQNEWRWLAPLLVELRERRKK